MSLGSPDAGEANARVGSPEDLVQVFRRGEKPAERFRVGTEHEKIGLTTDDHSPVPYDTPRGIRTLLETIAEVDGWTRILEGDRSMDFSGSGGGPSFVSANALQAINDAINKCRTNTIFMFCLR